ncbi:MAG TPA: helix-turn-helix transcriptional regulator, partial [Amycolatopsis sp.]|uniref:helix-turn-helix transcriptional regulator n=1 Tax=Amycolatopsis sp. TaxID=37632 RepID=UPI002F42C9EB
AAGETLAAVAASSLLLRRTGSGLRCHPVLRAVLKSVLREEYPEVVEELHARAAERLRREGDLDAAYEHARLAGLPGVAVRTAIETWPSAHPRTLLARLDEVPAEGRAVAAAAELACGHPGRAAARLGGDLVAAQGVAARAGSHPASAGTWLAPHDGDLAAAQGVAALAGRDPASAGTWLAPHDGDLTAAQRVARPAEADDPPALAVRAWLALHNGDLPTAHHIATQAIAAPRESTRPWWLLLAQAALGTAGLWEGKPVLDQLDETAREAEQCGYRDAAVRALDARAAASLLTGDVTAAQTTAAQAVAWHDLDPTRCATPVVATAFLASRRGSRYPATALASATPHAEAFAALLHAQSTSDTQQRRKAHAQARAALTGLRHGPVLADLLEGCGVPDFRPAVLSDRERAVLRALAGPLTLREIAAELHVSHNTVKTHVRSVFRKLGAHDRADAVSRGAAATRPW